MEKNKKELMNELARNFGDVESRQKLIELFGNENATYVGKNANGEDVSISFDTEDGIMLKTYREDGRVHVSYFNRRGYAEGESFDGKWK